MKNENQLKVNKATRKKELHQLQPKNIKQIKIEAVGQIEAKATAAAAAVAAVVREEMYIA